MRPKHSISTQIFQEEEMVIVNLQGEFSEPDLIQEVIEPFLGVMRSIVLDVQHLRYLTSACFGVFFQLNYGARSGISKLYFMNVESKFSIIFHGLGGANVFQIIETIDDI